jgi:hypothetical protein
MPNYTIEELNEALRVVTSTIRKCEDMQPKFAEGTPQHTLLRNRIKALHIAKSLIEGKPVADKYSMEELREALAPVSSIIRKCEKARSKFAEGTTQHARYDGILRAMHVSKSLIREEMDRKR